MGRISASAVLIFISGILISNYQVNGQEESLTTETPTSTKEIGSWSFDTTTSGILVETPNSCPSYVQSGLEICKTYVGVNDVLTSLLPDSTTDVCSFSFQQYACANVDTLTDAQCFQILNCVLTNPDAIITQGAFSLFFSKLSLTTIGSIFNRINVMVSSSSITDKAREYLLNAVWETLRQNPDNLAPGPLAVWFEEKLFLLTPAINTEILNCISSTAVNCDGLESIVKGLSLQYSTYSNESRAEIGMWITRFIKSRSCMKDNVATTISTYYSKFIADMNYDDFKEAFVSLDLSTAMEIFTESQVQQYIISTDALSSVDSAATVINLLETKDFAYNYGVLSNLPATNDYNMDVLFSLLSNLLDKFNIVDDPLCKPQIKIIFQGKLNYLLAATNEVILQKLAPQDCSTFQDIYQGLDAVYDMFTDVIKQLVYKYRFQFLDAEYNKTGSGCTYGLDSKLWIVKNIGRSIEFTSYAELIRLNANFDGYEVVSMLNVQQTIDMFINTELFTSDNPNNEARLSSVKAAWQIKGSTYVQQFLPQLKSTMTKMTFQFSIRIQIRFLEDVMDVMKPQFKTFRVNDWYNYMDSISLFLPVITTEQLSAMSFDVVGDCHTMNTIVGVLGDQHSNMNTESRVDVADWIADFLRNDTTHCITEEGDWLVDNFQVFKTDIKITVINEINPTYDLSSSIKLMAPNQLAQCMFVIVEAHTDVAFVEKIFDLVTNDTHEKAVDNLANFWIAYIANFEKDVNFTTEVRYTMLSRTVEELSIDFLTYTSEETTVWFRDRMYTCLPTIDTEVLSYISVDVPCGFQSSFVGALSFVFDETADSNREEIFNFILNYLKNNQQRPAGESCITQETSTTEYMTSFYGAYSKEASISDLILYNPNFDAFGVIQKLTDIQIGDLMAQNTVYESVDKVNQIFDYLETLTIVNVDEIMTQFSDTCTKKNINIDNPDVGQTMLQRYANFVKSKSTTYTAQQITKTLTIKIRILIQFYNEDTLSMFGVKDCDTLSAVVSGLNGGFNKMTDSTKTSIANWIVSMLKAPSINGCTNSDTTTTAWVQNNFGSFFKFSDLKQVQQIYNKLDMISIITQTSSLQKAQILCTSTTALTDINQTMTVLQALKGEDDDTSAIEVIVFLTDFNIEYGMLNVKIMSKEVQEAGMKFLFNSFISDLNGATELEITSFQETFKYFLGGISSESINLIPDSINCDTYQSLIGGFSSVYEDLSSDVRDTCFNKIVSFLNFHLSSTTTSVCSNSYSDSNSYITTMFQNFSADATIYIFQQYNSNFDAYSCLSKLTATQLGNLLMNTTAITDQLSAAQIAVEIKTRNFQQTKEFLFEIKMEATKKNWGRLPDFNVQSLIFLSVWQKFSVNLKTPQDYTDVFGGGMSVLASSFQVSNIEALSTNIDCNAQSKVVECFSSAFAYLDDKQKASMLGRIKDFNTKIKDSTGQACPTKSGTSDAWILQQFGEFGQLATITDFTNGDSNFHPESAFNVCTGPQIAQYIVSVGGLKNEDLIVKVLDNMDSSIKIQGFLDFCNTNAPNDLQTSRMGDLILEKTFDLISVEIKTFQTTDWQTWFQVTLVNILQYINETQLEMIDYPLPCASYQEMVLGLSNAYDRMNDNSRKAVYTNCIQAQLNSVKTTTGVKCGQQNENVEVWIQNNIGKFASYIQITEYTSWNVQYKAVEMITTLSAYQLATFAVTAVNNEDVACQVAARVASYDVSDVITFLNTFSVSLSLNNIKSFSSVVANKFMTSVLSVVSGSFSTWSSSQWEDFMADNINTLMFGLDATQLTTMLQSADCDSYKSIFEQVNDNYDNYQTENRQEIFNALYTFISQKQTSSGFCTQSGDDAQAVITSSIGQFASYLSYAQFKAMSPNFSWLSSSNLLGPSQMADVCFSESVFTDQARADVLISRINNFTLPDLDIYLQDLKSTADSKNIVSLQGGAVQPVFDAIYNRVSPQFGFFNDSKWSEYFLTSFQLFFTSIQVNHVEAIPDTLSCGALRSVVTGCSNNYKQLQGDVKAAFYNKAMGNLKNQKASTGTACPSNGDSGQWLVSTLGGLRDQATLTDLYAINPNFAVTDAAGYLSPGVLGTYLGNSMVLLDSYKVETCMAALNSQTVGAFLDAFNAAAKVNGVTEISNAAVQTLFIGEIFCKIGSGFSSFTSENYTTFFGTQIEMLLPALDARAFGFLPKNLDCDSLAAIMAPVNQVTNPEYSEDVFNFVYAQLTARKAATGNACTEGLDTRTWVAKFMDKNIIDIPWSVLVNLNPDFDLATGADLLSTQQRADASTSSSTTQNITVISSMMLTFNGDITSLYNFFGTIKQYSVLNPELVSNSKVREVLLSAVALDVLPAFGNLPASNISDWMNRISFLLPYFNSTLLDDIPTNIDCLPFQAIVSGMDTVYTSLTPVRQQAVADFIKRVLSAKVQNGDDPCSIGAEQTNQYINRNFASFCYQLSFAIVQAIYPKLQPVSYNSMCTPPA